MQHTTLKKTKGATLGLFFAALGLVLGFLVYDGLASPQKLKNADCATLEFQLQGFFNRTEEFSADDPAKWHQVRSLYRQFSKDLKNLRLDSNPMIKRLQVLIEATDGVAKATYGTIPSQRNRQRVAEAREGFRQALASMGKVCP